MQGIYVQYKVVFNRKNELNKEGKALIQIRAYHDGQNKYFSTGIYIPPNEWNDKKMQPKDPILILKVEQLLVGLKGREFEVRNKRKTFSLADFDSFGQPIEAIKPTQISFTQFYEQQIEAERTLAQPSWRMRRRSLEVFIEFRKDILFTDVDFKMLHKFEQFLGGKGFQQNTIHKHQKHLRKYVRLAHNYEHITKNPFDNYPLRQVEARSQFLTIEEVQRLENLTFSPGQSVLEKARDMFLFSAFTGLRFSDTKALTPKNFITTPDGLEFEFKANKTKKYGKKYLYLLYGGKPQEIAKKYLTDDLDRALFKISNPKVNKLIKELAKLAGITKHLCFKDSRDTFGTDMITKADFRLVQDELQHSSPKQTQKYMQMNDELKKQRLTQIKWYGNN